MKTKIIVASSALAVFCCLFIARTPDSISVVSELDTPVSVITAKDSKAQLAKDGTQPTRTKNIRLNTTHNDYMVRTNCNETIECKRGTKLFFPANSFVDSNGLAVKGKVRLVVDECYDLDEMIAAKLSTTGNGKRLETAGMLRVRAYSNKTEVFLRKDARYNIHFPVSENPNEDFELFYGCRNNDYTIDWKLEPNSDPIPEESTSGSSLSNDCFIQISASQLRCGTHIREMDYFNWPLVNGQNLHQWFVANFNPDPELVDDFCVNKLISQITFQVNMDGSFRNYYISHTAGDRYDRAIAETLSNMPPLDMKRFMPKFSDDHTCILTFGRQQERDSESFINRFVKRYDYADSTRKMTGVDTDDLNYYVFSSTELGWINCDRFLLDQGPLVDVIIETDLSESAFVSMVFDKDRSIVSATKNGRLYVFRNVPANRDVRIIAIDNPGGTPVMEVGYINTSCKQHTMQSARAITLADLNNSLCWN